MDILLGTLFIIICVMLIVVVLLQRGRGGGLGSAFGGLGGDVFTWVTIVLTALFLLLAVGTSFVFRPAAQQVATPQLRPPSSDEDSLRYVTITCTTDHAKIHYTLDGSDPTEQSKQYESGSSVKVQPGHTLKARAYRTNWEPSPLAKGYYGPPVEPPSTAPAGEDG